MKKCRCIHCQHCIHVFEPLVDGHSKIVGLYTICNKNGEFENRLATGVWYNGNRFALLKNIRKINLTRDNVNIFYILHIQNRIIVYCHLDFV